MSGLSYSHKQDNHSDLTAGHLDLIDPFDTFQIDPGQLQAGSYRIFEVELQHSQGLSLLATIYVTADQMPGQQPTIGNHVMEAKREYWVFSNDGLDDLDQMSEGSKLILKHLGVSSQSLSADPQTSRYFLASQQTQWTLIGTTQPPAGIYKFIAGGGSQQVIRAIGLSLDNQSAPDAWWWIQGGTSNLTQTDIAASVLEEADGSATPANDYFGTSSFTAFSPFAAEVERPSSG